MRIYIIDDEPRQRRGMEQLVRSLYPQSNILTFNNGLLAVQSMDEHPADVIFSDIRMPHMSGLELAEHVYQTHPYTIIILVSAYAEFEYAQKAISLHVFEYLIKPVQPSKIKEILIRAVAHMDMLHAHTGRHPLRMPADPIRHWETLMLQHYPQVDPEHIYRITAPHTDGRYVHMEAPERMSYTAEDWAEVSENLKYWFEKHLSARTICCALTPEGCIRLDAFLPKKYLSVKELRQFQHTAQHDYHLTLNILVSRFYLQLGDHWQDIRQDIESLRPFLFYHPPGAVLVHDDLSAFSSRSLFCPVEQYADLVKAVCSHDTDLIARLCSGILSGFADANISPDSFRESCAHLVMKLFESIRIFDSNMLNGILASIRSADSFLTVKQSVTTSLCCVSDMLEQSLKEAKPIQKAILYIEKNYDQKISVNDAAQLCHYSVSHFSAIFKAHTGQNFVTYLNEVRLRHVLQLLLTTDWDICEIAGKTGFSDVNYLNRLFKRAYGTTAQNYRETLRKGEMPS